MANIDFSKVQTNEARAVRKQKDVRVALKAEARRRIAAVFDDRTQMNLVGAAIAGDLSRAEMAVFRASRLWNAETLAASRAAVSSGADPVWPDAPTGLAELVARF
ncbi:hypothetical protein [Antarctobacter heliothermus]|uniref:Uncharacterized protein n=1 Tax=Antarctobacter heliothermus TaxID=74033 RepID=A0A239JY11_9RHOB|nr:hypothetical protein [Antarctobacter heliothermus]SNT10886.1 hypothetical protein SAMN04488078_105820 [Antarctobacter heliothermus]